MHDSMNFLTIVEYTDPTRPVLFEGKIYQVCIIDWDGDLVLKDDQLNGVKIVPVGWNTNDPGYDDALLEMLPEHPLNKIKQLSQNGQIMHGCTDILQNIVDKYYEQNNE